MLSTALASLLALTTAGQVADVAIQAPAPSLEVRPHGLETIPLNARTFVTGTYASESDSIVGTLAFGTDSVDLIFETTCGRDQPGRCLHSAALEGLTEGETVTLSVSDGLSDRTIDAVVGPEDLTPPAAPDLSVTGLFFSEGNPDEDGGGARYWLDLAVTSPLDDDAAVVELIAVTEGEDGVQSATTLGYRLVDAEGSLGQGFTDRFEGEEARTACYSLVVTDLAGHQTELEEPLCVEISEDTAEHVGPDILPVMGCSSSPDAAGYAPLLGLLGLVLVRRRRR